MPNKPWTEAIIEVLRDAGGSLTRTEIAEAIVSKRLRDNVGATPASTVVSRISTNMAEKGEQSPFVRVGRGEYALRDVVRQQSTFNATTERAIQEESKPGCVNALGVYWQRELVNWNRSPKLLGQQQIGAQVVDMAEQIGIYLLYDIREIVYVGRSIERPLGLRLYEHTQDRLRARWNRFSWFGLYALTETGELIKQASAQEPASVVKALEAVLIESLEPRQNRKRGDELSGIEYIQKPDPKIDRMRKLSVLTELAESVGGEE